MKQGSAIREAFATLGGVPSARQVKEFIRDKWPELSPSDARISQIRGSLDELRAAVTLDEAQSLCSWAQANDMTLLRMKTIITAIERSPSFFDFPEE